MFKSSVGGFIFYRMNYTSSPDTDSIENAIKQTNDSKFYIHITHLHIDED